MNVDVNGIVEVPKSFREPMVTNGPFLQGRPYAITSVDRGPVGPLRGRGRPDRNPLAPVPPP